MLLTLRKLFFKILLGTVFIIGIMVFANRFFAGIYANRLLNNDRVSSGGLEIFIGIVILVIFVFVFPFIYIWHLKLTVLGKAVSTVWNEYRDDFLQAIVGPVVRSSYAMYEKGGAVIHNLSTHISDLPRMIQWILGYIKNKIPLYEQLEQSLSELDWDGIEDIQSAEQQVLQSIQAQVETKMPANTHSSVWLIILVNIVCAMSIIFLIG